MPKKRQKTTFSKPINTAHHTLSSSSSDHHQNARSSPSTSSSTTDQPSVNDLINHLRRTQVSFTGGRVNQPKFVAPRSVHPSLRNVLEVPDTPPPRPRPNAHRIEVGGRRLRRAPGPPPPDSWLAGSSNSRDEDDLPDSPLVTTAYPERKIFYRLDRLPGATFPAQNALLHLVLKAMALNWTWHVEYDGQFLGLLPSQIKVLLLSYIAIYARGQPLGRLMRGLAPLFQNATDTGNEDQDGDHLYQDTDLGISRLDLGGAIGHWITFKQLTKELIMPQKQGSASTQRKGKDAVPLSWEEEYENETDFAPGAEIALPKSASKCLRFENLRFLSLAHPNPASASWKSLLDLLSHLSTLTHLSLAYWPVPTFTPNAMNARVRHPTQRSLSFAYSATDSYSALENNWAGAASVLRMLSRVTYCLKWLDLEGCEDWIPALNYTHEESPSEEGVASPRSMGPEWNGSWRNIEYVRLGPGYLPQVDAILRPPSQPNTSMSSTSRTPLPNLSQQFSSRSLAWSIHAPSASSNEDDPSSLDQDLPWVVEEERVKYRQSKELERFHGAVNAAVAAQKHIQGIRRQGRGKWVHFSFGLENLGVEELRLLLGQDYMSVLP
ncbi:tafazzin [Aspergillus sclerotialis]|uniref:Tafazzin n=1 Tax=Aspergillus sclerotialis TaxID=2070753 RepID=A0A3A2ZP26_9EURO|nr:tafazzin [Aspergillus sclerotialis]